MLCPYLSRLAYADSSSHRLERLFTALPPRCIVLLEDIDAVGIKRQPHLSNEDEENDDEDDEEEEKFNPHRSRCTLSGVLNVLDGVASQVSNAMCTRYFALN